MHLLLNLVMFLIGTPFTCSKSTKKNTRVRSKICSNLTIKTPEWHHRGISGIYIVNFHYPSQLFLDFERVKIYEKGNKKQ